MNYKLIIYWFWALLKFKYIAWTQGQTCVYAQPLHTCEKWRKNPVSAPLSNSETSGRTEWLHLDTWGNCSAYEQKKLWERETSKWHEKKMERKTLSRRGECLRCWGWDAEASEITCESPSQRIQRVESRNPFEMLNSWKKMSKLSIFVKRGFKNTAHGCRLGCCC